MKHLTYSQMNYLTYQIIQRELLSCAFEVFSVSFCMFQSSLKDRIIWLSIQRHFPTSNSNVLLQLCFLAWWITANTSWSVCQEILFVVSILSSLWWNSSLLPRYCCSCLPPLVACKRKNQATSFILKKNNIYPFIFAIILQIVSWFWWLFCKILVCEMQNLSLLINHFFAPDKPVQELLMWQTVLCSEHGFEHKRKHSDTKFFKVQRLRCYNLQHLWRKRKCQW